MLLQLIHLLGLRIIEQARPLHIEIDLLLRPPKLLHTGLKLICPIHMIVILLYPPL